MPRPRTPSNVLDMRGAFKKHPERKREDLQGVGDFNSTPPQWLAAPIVPAWHRVVSQINPAVLTGSDTESIAVMARLLSQFELTSDKTYATELRQWFSQYGMTAVGRTKLAAPKKGGGGNPFLNV